MLVGNLCLTAAQPGRGRVATDTDGFCAFTVIKKYLLLGEHIATMQS